MKRTKPQPVDFTQIGRFLAGARRKLDTARKTLAIDEEASFQLAYEAMLKAALGLMLSHGTRPRSLPGHHITIIEFAGEKLGPGFRGLIALFNRMRRKRHEAIYDASGLISRHEAEEALKTAGKLIEAIAADIQTRSPQEKIV